MAKQSRKRNHILFCIHMFVMLCSACGYTKIQSGQEFGPLRQIKQGFVSFFIVNSAPQKVILFDTGTSPKGEKILAELTRQGLTPEDVQAIFFTHHHRDHIGAALLFPLAKKYALSQEIPLIQNAKIPRFHRKAGRIKPPEIIELQDGDIVEVGSRQVEVFFVPGHTPGSAAYLIENILIMGDTAVAKKDGTLQGPPRLFSDDPEENDTSVLQLFARLSRDKKEIDWIVFSHSGAVLGQEGLESFRK